MEVLAMGLHPRERRKLRQIEEALRRDDPGLDTLLTGGQERRRSVPRARAAGGPVAWVMAAYLVPPALITAGLLLDAIWLVVVGAVLCPLVPILGWLLIRRFGRGGASHGRSP
jgi:hypothetical protein